VARTLFAKGAADKVIVAGLGKSRSAMHLDTVFSFCDRDLVTIFPEVANSIVPFVLRPDESKPGGIDLRRDERSFLDVVAESLNLKKLRVVETGGDATYIDWGKPTQKSIAEAHPDELDKLGFAAGSMGPKVQAACEFARNTGSTAVIGSLENIEAIVQGKSGTRISLDYSAIAYR
jgi:hypothetical protein